MSLTTLSKNIQLSRCIIPQAVSITKNPDDESPAQIIERQNKFISLSETIKNKLIAHKTGEQIQQIGQSFNLELLQMADISRAIRSYYFGELKLEDMPFYLAKEIPIDLEKAREISRMVIEKIINDNSIEQASAAKLENMTIFDAMKNYPEIGEQLITAEKIQLKNFPEPVRPSIKNWLADYTFTIGFDNKDSVKRGNYLFHSVNTSRLSSNDRQKVAYILKAYDDGALIMVNKDLKQIVFQAPKTSTSSQSKARLFAPQQENSLKPSFRGSQQQEIPNAIDKSSASLHNTISYSSPQKLPYEKTDSPQTTPTPVKYARSDHASQEFNGARFPYYQKPSQIKPADNIVRLEPKPVPPRELPKNVVNLRDN